MNATSGMFRAEKNGETVENNFYLLLEVVHIFETLEFAVG